MFVLRPKKKKRKNCISVTLKNSGSKTYRKLLCSFNFSPGMDSLAEYSELMGNIELFNKLWYFALNATCTFCFYSALPYTCIRYFIFDMGKESYYLFYPTWFVFTSSKLKRKFERIKKKLNSYFLINCIRWPFDWRTPLGYLVAYPAQCVGNIYIAYIYVDFLNLYFGSCWLFYFIAKDIVKDLVAFNTVMEQSKKTHAVLMERFCNMVQVFMNAKR